MQRGEHVVDLAAIAAGLVRVGGAIDPKPATLVAPNQSVHLVGPPEPYVSRAGRKLAGALDELGITDNTVVFYSTDNGPHYNTWPDAASTPFRGEKNTNWEGGWRVPALMRWPGVIPAGSVSNEIVHHMDMLPTFLAAAGKPDIKEDLLDGYSSEALGREYKIHLDGYDLSDHLKDPDNVPSPRKEIFYFSDDGDLTALRYEDCILPADATSPVDHLAERQKVPTDHEAPLFTDAPSVEALALPFRDPSQPETAGGFYQRPRVVGRLGKPMLYGLVILTGIGKRIGMRKQRQ